MTTTPLPPLPDLRGGIYKHTTLGDLYDRLQVEQLMVLYATSARADLEIRLQAEKNLHAITGKAYAKVVEDYQKSEAEVARLREELATVRGEALEPATNKSHRCIKCLYAYSPEGDESEDCPSCGHDGSELKETP